MIGVVDGCPDGSGALMERLSERYPRVAAVVLGQNGGQQRAVLTGLSRAKGTFSVVLDADLQDSPEAIPKLLAGLERGYDAVFAGRRGNCQPGFRKLSSKLFKSLLRCLCGVPSDAGLFVGVSRAMAEKILNMRTGQPYVLGMIGCAGLPMTSVPVERRPRPCGTSSYTFFGRLKAGIGALTTVLAIRRACKRRGAGGGRVRRVGSGQP
jgi:hypothetical protein